MSTVPLSCHENPICLILPIGQQLPNYHKVLQLYKYVFKEIESCLQNLKEGQECVENICDLIIILCQSASGNATTVLESRNLLIFLWTLRNFDFTSTSSLFTDITQVKLYEHKIASKENTFHFVFDLVLCWTKQALINANSKRNLLCRQWWCIPIYVFAFTVLSPSDWTTAWLSTAGL